MKKTIAITLSLLHALSLHGMEKEELLDMTSSDPKSAMRITVDTSEVYDAVIDGNLAAVRKLTAGFDAKDFEDEGGILLGCCAVEYDAAKILSFFITEKELDPARRDPELSTLLHNAAETDSIEAAKVLLAYNKTCAKKATESKGDAEAPTVKHIDLCKLLNSHRLQPIQVAVAHGSRGVFQLLFQEFPPAPGKTVIRRGKEEFPPRALPILLFCWASRKFDGLPDHPHPETPMVYEAKKLPDELQTQRRRCLTKIIRHYTASLKFYQTCALCPSLGIKETMVHMSHCCGSFIHLRCYTDRVSFDTTKPRKTPTCHACGALLTDPLDLKPHVDLPDHVFNMAIIAPEELSTMVTAHCEGRVVVFPREVPAAREIPPLEGPPVAPAVDDTLPDPPEDDEEATDSSSSDDDSGAAAPLPADDEEAPDPLLEGDGEAPVYLPIPRPLEDDTDESEDSGDEDKNTSDEDEDDAVPDAELLDDRD